jgi:hypothetical protein
MNSRKLLRKLLRMEIPNIISSIIQIIILLCVIIIITRIMKIIYKGHPKKDIVLEKAAKTSNEMKMTTFQVLTPTKISKTA